MSEKQWQSTGLVLYIIFAGVCCGVTAVVMTVEARGFEAVISLAMCSLCFGCAEAIARKESKNG